MSPKEFNPSSAPSWDLTVLYHDTRDWRLTQDLDGAHDRARRFAAAYRGSVQFLPVPALLDALQTYESIHEQMMRPYLYAELCHTADARNKEYGLLHEEVVRRCHGIAMVLLFFQLELQALPDSHLEQLAIHPSLPGYGRFFEKLLALKPYALSEDQERLISYERHRTRTRRLSDYDSWVSSLTFRVPGVTFPPYWTAGSAMGALRSPDRDLRERVFTGFLQELGSHKRNIAHLLGSLVRLDHHEQNLRQLPNPWHHAAVTNGLDPTFLETVMTAAPLHDPLLREYYGYKAEVLGIEPFRESDLWAPVTPLDRPLEYGEAREQLLQALGGVHPIFRALLDRVFQGGWIDADLRRGKTQAPFCKCFSPSQHPFISLNFTQRAGDLLTFAHELGHAIHYRLASCQSYLNFAPPPILAETSATFFEMLLVHHLQHATSSPNDRTAYLSAHLDNLMTTVFRQHLITRFEMALHRSNPDEQGADHEMICDLWWDAHQQLYGEAVTFSPLYRYGWMTVPHIFHRPFYCFNYVIGNLLSMALFEMYLEGGRHFLSDLVALLGAGGSRHPQVLLAKLGVAPDETGFWDLAFGYAKKRLAELKVLTAAGVTAPP